MPPKVFPAKTPCSTLPLAAQKDRRRPKRIAPPTPPPRGVLAAIRDGLCGEQPHANVGGLTLAVNPFRELPLYGEEWTGRYLDLDPGLPAHVYGTAAAAYRELAEGKGSQQLVLVGEQASGKSRAFGDLLEFLVHAAGDGELDAKVSAVPGLLRPLLCVRSLANEAFLSTRAVLRLDLAMDGDHFVCRAAADVSLLEATCVDPRVTGQRLLPRARGR